MTARIDPATTQPAIRIVAMPADTHVFGDKFGASLMSLMGLPYQGDQGDVRREEAGCFIFLHSPVCEMSATWPRTLHPRTQPPGRACGDGFFFSRTVVHVVHSFTLRIGG